MSTKEQMSKKGSLSVQINALAAYQPGGLLRPFTYEVGPPEGHQALIKVQACGLCHSDLHVLDGEWGEMKYPLVLGHEVIGEVAALGPLAAQLSVGERVGVGWQSGACLHCRDCLQGDDNLCADQTATILGGRGGFADYLLVDSRFAFSIPPSLGSHAAGPLLCGGVTVYSGLRHAGMGSGQEIGIVGLGGLGHLAVQFAFRLGNRVTAFTTSPDKAAFAVSLGAAEAVVLEPGGKFPAPKRNLDIILDTVPHTLDWEGCLSHLGSDGVLNVVAVPEEPLSIPVLAFQDKRRRTMGSSIGSRSEMRDMLALAAEYGILPLVETFPFSHANEALDRLRANAVRYRAVLVPD